MSAYPSPLARLLPLMRAAEDPASLERHERIEWGRRARELGITLVWDQDLPAIASAAVKTIRERILGPERNGR